MDGAADQLLSRSRLAEDADSDVALGDAVDERKDLAHARTVADDSVDRLAPSRRWRIVLIEKPVQSMILRARAEQRCDRMARCLRPGVRTLDEQQLAFAATQPV